MNRNIMIVLGGAILAAFLVAMLVQVSMGGKKTVKAGDTSVEVLVAARSLKSSHELEKGDLKWVVWPEETMFSGAIVRKEQKTPEETLTGRLARDIAQDEPVKRDAILKAKTGNFVAASLGKGERAVSIKVKPETMVAGFIGPGTYVDVILTYKQEIKSNNREDDPQFQSIVDRNFSKYAAETVIQNARVLALDQITERDFDDAVKTSKTVTLAVSFRDAEKLALASTSKMGVVTLSMRGVGDNEVPEKQPTVTDARMATIDDEVYAEYQKIKNGKKNGIEKDIVKVYNGGSVAARQAR